MNPNVPVSQKLSSRHHADSPNHHRLLGCVRLLELIPESVTETAFSTSDPGLGFGIGTGYIFWGQIFIFPRHLRRYTYLC